MTSSRAVDVLIAGAGLAGLAPAAALGEFGWEVLVVEPGLDSTRRLAGELIHPPGTTDLATLGLLPHLEETGGMSVRGFAVVSAAARADQGGRMHVLPYAPVAGRAGMVSPRSTRRSAPVCGAPWRGCRTSPCGVVRASPRWTPPGATR